MTVRYRGFGQGIHGVNLRYHVVRERAYDAGKRQAVAQTLVEYVQDNQRTFAEEPLNAVDSLVFSTLSYLQFDLQGILLEGNAQVLLHDVVALGDWSRLCSRGWMENSECTEPFMRAIMASRRWRDVRLSFYVEEFSEVADKQFMAITFTYPVTDGRQSYIAFRGTDGTVAGWREDFNLSYMQVIPSHNTAMAYVSGVAGAFDGTLVLGGHSKGGNLAEFSALNCDESVFERIVAVYNHDGPSFLEAPSPRVGDERYRAMHHKIIPESSMIGMILETGGQYRVAQSSAMGLKQHDPFTWLVEGRDFATKPELNGMAKFFSHAINSWALSYTPPERRRYVSTVFSVLGGIDATRFEELKENPLVTLQSVVEESVAIEEEDKRFVLDTTMALAEQMKSQVRENVAAQAQALNPIRWVGQLDIHPIRDRRRQSHVEGKSQGNS